MRLGSSTPAAYYLGSTAVARLYLGSNRVFGPAPAVNPTLSTVDFTAPGSGAPQRLDITASYLADPADTLQLIFATRNGGTALTAAQLLAGTGTFLERVVVNPFSGTEVALSSLTATSEAATAVDVILAEVNNGGVSAVVTETVSGLDFTPESRVSVTTNTAGDEVIVTWSGTLFDPAAAPDIAAGDFAMTGHTLTSPVLSGATVTLSVSPSVAFGDSDTLNYTGTALKDVNGNTIATFSGVAVTNSVPASGPRLLGQAQLSPTVSVGPHTISVPTPGHVSGERIYAFLSTRAGSAPGDLSGATITIDGEAVTTVGLANNLSGTAFRNNMICVKLDPSGALPATTDVIVTFAQARHRIHVEIYAVPGSVASEGWDSGFINNADGTVDVSQDTVTGDHVIVYAVSRGVLGTFTLAGVTAGSIVEVPDSAQLVLSGLATGVTGETPRTMSATKTSPDSSKDLVVGSLRIRPA